VAKKQQPEPINCEVQLITTEAQGLGAFVKGLLTFLKEAREIERDAKSQLAIAKTFLRPTTVEEDTGLKEAVRLFTQKKKAAEDHWGVCQLVSRFHRRLTSARARAIDPLEEAVAIGTRLHTDYVVIERRKAEEAERKLREEAERQAREQHEAELQKLDAEALALEEQSADLSERERVFVDAWFATFGNAKEAARRAGYKDVVAAAARLAGSEKIKAAIEAREHAQALRAQAQAVRQAPVEVPEIRIEAAVDTNGDRSRCGAELVDEAVFIEAVLAGKHGIPSDVLCANRPKLNDYARSLGPRIELWPGVRFVRKTTIV